MHSNPPRPAEGVDDASLTDVIELVHMAVNRVFSISLVLASAREGLGDHPASDRISEAVDGMDALIRELRRVAFAGYATAADTAIGASRHPVAGIFTPPQGDDSSTEELLDSIRNKQRASLQGSWHPTQAPHSA